MRLFITKFSSVRFVRCEQAVTFATTTAIPVVCGGINAEIAAAVVAAAAVLTRRRHCNDHNKDCSNDRAEYDAY